MGSAGGAFRAIPRWIRLLVGFPKMPKFRMSLHFQVTKSTLKLCIARKVFGMIFHVFKNDQFCLLCIVVLSVLEFNLCSSFLCQSPLARMGLMNDGIVPSKKSRAYFQIFSKSQLEFNFLFGSLFIQCLLVGEKYVVQSSHSV